MAEFVVHSPSELQRACDVAQAGDTIKVHGGSYPAPSRLHRRHGTVSQPIVVRAADAGWILGGRAADPHWGVTSPAEEGPSKPTDKDFAFLLIDDCSHVRIEGLKIQDCWPSIFFVKDTTHLTVRGCTLRHGTYAVFAKGQDTSHLLLEGNEWRQDDSVDHQLWNKIDWKRSHGDEGSDGLYRYFNGGFLSSKNIRGNVVVRHNRIMDAYNGIRLKAMGDNDRPLTRPEWPTCNADVHIVGNDFIRIRDNPIEPEGAAYNWHVRHNRLVDCHGWFSFDGVGGGYWYFYGNTGRFESRQGASGDASHSMGRVLKLSYERRPRAPLSEITATHPWFVFNNSWHLRCPLIGGASPGVPLQGEGPDFTTNLAFFNNAFAWCDPGRYGPWVCEFVELMRYFDWRRSVGTTFDYDISDRADYFAWFRQNDWGETNGTLATRPIFANPGAGIFQLAPDSEAKGNGSVRSVVAVPPDPGAPAPPVRLRRQADGSVNRGCYQDYGATQVPELEGQLTSLLRGMGLKE
jgi:hypothetical protein